MGVRTDAHDHPRKDRATVLLRQADLRTGQAVPQMPRSLALVPPQGVASPFRTPLATFTKEVMPS
jgi:hypothetical protein